MHTFDKSCYKKGSKMSFFPGALKEMVSACKEGQSVRELCVKADALLLEETGKAFKKDKKVQKGKITNRGGTFLAEAFKMLPAPTKFSQIYCSLHVLFLQASPFHVAFPLTTVFATTRRSAMIPTPS